MRNEAWVPGPSPWLELPAHAAAEKVQALLSAIRSDQIQPYYQPIIDYRTRRVLGFEALARWISPVGDGSSPAVFIPLAASAGLLNLLTQRLLEQACREAVQWPAHLTLAINLAPSQFLDESLPSMIEACARANHFPLSRLIVEITEEALQGSSEQATTMASELRQLGVRLAMDDFGVGDSNIRRLGLVEFDILKVDRCVISTMTADKQTQRGLVAAIAVGTSLGMQVIAEGVEEQWQASLIESLGCPSIQGWFSGRPMPACDLPAFFAGTDQASAEQSSRLALTVPVWPDGIVPGAPVAASVGMAEVR